MSPTLALRALVAASLAASLPAQSTIRLTAGLGGAEPDGPSGAPSVSRDGRFVVFHSDADNLTADDTSPARDVFLFDRTTGTLELVSVRTAPLTNGDAAQPVVTDDGRYVAFLGAGDDLAPGSSAAVAHVLLRDRSAGTTTRITTGWAGNALDVALTPDASHLAFTHEADNVVSGGNGTDVFRYDRTAGTFHLVSRNSAGVPGNSNSRRPAWSANGAVVAFESTATNLALSDLNGVQDVFVHTIQSGGTRRVSVNWLGQELPTSSSSCGISRSGLRVAFATTSAATSGDLNALSDVYLSEAGFVWRASTDAAQRGSDGSSGPGAIAGDQRYLVFLSDSRDLVSPPLPAFDTHVYLKDLETAAIEIVSLDESGLPAPNPSEPAVSAHGRFVAFVESAGLVSGDAGGHAEIYLRDRGPIVYTTPCAGDGTSAPCPCGNPGQQGNGCENYGLTGGARLSATGTPSVANDTLRLAVNGLPLAPAALSFSQGDSLGGGGLGVPFGDGVRCIAGQVVRLRVTTASNGMAAYGHGVAGDPPVSVQGAVGPAGGTRYYQVSYRSVGSFCFQLKMNWSNSIAVVWEP
jgi:Tol biopolymer transport system component